MKRTASNDKRLSALRRGQGYCRKSAPKLRFRGALSVCIKSHAHVAAFDENARDAGIFYFMRAAARELLSREW
ncbi:MAG: hypothetical protein Q4C72_09030 [Eubacteriales bacterium]|nr:hypothetical protein [Eubacteriales bacterium]